MLSRRTIYITHHLIIPASRKFKMLVNSPLMVLLPLLVTALAMPSSPAMLFQKRSVTCLKVGASAKATWTDSAGKTCTYTGVVGSNYGTNAAGGE